VLRTRSRRVAAVRCGRLVVSYALRDWNLEGLLVHSMTCWATILSLRCPRSKATSRQSRSYAHGCGESGD